MESTDRELLLEINGRLVRIETRLDNLEVRVSALEERMTRQEIRMDTFETELRHTNDKIDWMQTTIYWGFAILGVAAAYVPLFRREKNEQPAPTPIVIYPPRPEDYSVKAG